MVSLALGQQGECVCSGETGCGRCEAFAQGVGKLWATAGYLQLHSGSREERQGLHLTTAAHQLAGPQRRPRELCLPWSCLQSAWQHEQAHGHHREWQSGCWAGGV